MIFCRLQVDEEQQVNERVMPDYKECKASRVENFNEFFIFRTQKKHSEIILST